MTESLLTDQALTVGQVAERFGVTVRTVHHYDQIGLLVPSERTLAGYRLYTGQDVERLAAIVGYRRLGFGLAQIARLLSGGDLVEHLRHQRATVRERLDELSALAAALDNAIEEATMGEGPATTEHLKALFGDGFEESYAVEAQDRWGETESWAQSRRRTSAYTAADWASIKAEMDAVNAGFVAAFRSGAPSDSAVAVRAAEEHRRHIDTRYYDLSHAAHQLLGQMYVADPRFRAHYEALAPGLAAYICDAITANASRHP